MRSPDLKAGLERDRRAGVGVTAGVGGVAVSVGARVGSPVGVSDGLAVAVGGGDVGVLIVVAWAGAEGGAEGRAEAVGSTDVSVQADRAINRTIRASRIQKLYRFITSILLSLVLYES